MKISLQPKRLSCLTCLYFWGLFDRPWMCEMHRYGGSLRKERLLFTAEGAEKGLGRSMECLLGQIFLEIPA